MTATQPPPNEQTATTLRRALMRACVDASLAELDAALAALAPIPAAIDLRAPEQGSVMLRGRIGGDGAPFNVGEATMTRAVVRLANGVVGYGHSLGRVPAKARCAAIIDALGQTPEYRRRLDELLVAPVATRVQRERLERAELVAATKVNFFTMVRGDD